MSTFNNFATNFNITDFAATTWEQLVRDGINPENTNWGNLKIKMMRNAHQVTTHMIKSYMDQMMSNMINHYNGALTTVYNKIATLEAQNVQLQAELTSLSESNTIAKTKVPEPPTFAGLENKMQLNDWLNQMALYCSALSIICDDQKIVHALTCLHTPASTYMKVYFDKVQSEANLGSWSDFAQELKNIYGQRDDKERAKKELTALWVNRDLAKKNFVKYVERYRTLARIVNYTDEVHIDKLKEVVPDEL